MRTLAALLLLAACGDDHGKSPDAQMPDAAAPDACPTCRSFAMATGGVQIVLGSQPLFQITAANVNDDGDVAAVHQDFFGIPWDEFEAGNPPPPEWVAIFDLIQQHVAGKDVFLSLAPVQGTGRQYLADKTVIMNGQVTTQSNWSVRCYDFASMADGASKKQAYLRYVDYMVRKFHPRWINVGVEMNLFGPCGTAWNGLVDVVNAAYDTAKAVDSTAVVFPSIQIDFLYGATGCASPMTAQQCYDANYAQLANLKRDRFAISTYPFLIDAIKTVPNLPADWFTRGGDRGGERTVVAETGWLSTSAAGQLNGQCVTALSYTEADQAAYLDRLLGDAQAHGMDLVTWWSNRDLEVAQLMTDCPCTFNAQWCQLVTAFRSLGGTDPMQQFLGEMTLKIFGTMGLRSYDGTPHAQTMARWQQAKSMPH